jgi:hypothetical protein
MSTIPETTGRRASSDERFIPVDDSLPGLRVLLDPAGVRKLLLDRKALTSVEAEGQIAYLRYKPATSCVVLYAFSDMPASTEAVAEGMVYGKCFTSLNFAAALAKALAGSTPANVPGAAVIPLPDCCTILYRFPYDAELFGLKILTEPKKLQRLLYDLVEPYPAADWRISDRKLRTTTIRYKPEKRAVLRVDTRGVHRSSGRREDIRVYLRTYNDDRGAQAHRFMTELHEQSRTRTALRIPQSYGYVSDRRLLLIESLPGSSIQDDLCGGDCAPLLEQTARALSAFHDCTSSHVPQRTRDTVLQDGRATGRLLKQVLPEVGSKVEHLLTTLERLALSLPREEVALVHGDFYYGQVLRQGEQVSIIDFDRSFLGDKVADVGNFAAHLRLLQLEGRITNAADLEHAFVKSYEIASGSPLDSGSYAFWTALGLFQLSVRPFRSLRPGWAPQVEAILAECEMVLP